MDHQTTWAFAFERWKSALGGWAGFAFLVLMPAGLGAITGAQGNAAVNWQTVLVSALIGGLGGPSVFYLWNLFVAPYDMLKAGREEIARLNDQLKPLIRLSLAGIDSIVERLRLPNQPPFEAPARAVRVKVECLGGTHVTGSAFLTRMQRSLDGGKTFDEVDLHTPLPLNSNIHATKNVFDTFEFMRAHADDTLTWAGESWPLHLKHLFQEPALFRLRLVLSWWDQEGVVSVEVDWRGKMESVRAREIAEF